jgi:sortase A
VGVVGELLITAGVLLLLLVAYQLWWTNVQAAQASEQVATELQQSWAEPVPDAPDSPDSPDGDESAPEGYVEPTFGRAFAMLYIPRLSEKVWATPILQGVTPDVLAKGIGHYLTSAMPGEVGNFAIAGHRATNGEPLRNIDRLEVGDQVYVETRDTWYVYRLERDQIVLPTATWVIDPVPGQPGAEPTERLITITTCNPRWASTQRWVWWGSLVDTIDKATGQVPPAIEQGR